MAAITLTSVLIDLAPLDGLRIVNEAMSDSAGAATGGEAVPDPLTWNTTAPVGNYDYSCIAIGMDGTNPNTLASQTRFSGRGAVKISDHWALVADHAQGLGAWWQDSDGNEYNRTWDSVANIDGGDLSIAHFATALPEIPNAVVCSDVSQLAGQYALALEMDRHLNRVLLASDLDNADASVTWTATTADVLEGGDSGKPVFVPFGGRIVCLGAIFTTTGAPNVSKYITDINAELAGDSEALTVATLAFAGGDRATTSRPAAYSASMSAISPHSYLLGT